MFSGRQLVGIAVALIIVGGVAWLLSTSRPTSTYMEILAPAAGETIVEGSTQTIIWKSEGVPATHKIAISIRRIPPPPLQEEGQEFDPLVFTDLPNTGSATWHVSDMYRSGTYVLGITAYESTPVTDPITAESASFSIIPPLPQDLLPLYDGVNWSGPHLFPLDIPDGPLFGTAVEAVAATSTMNASSFFNPFHSYYREKLRALGWKVDIALEAGGPGSEQTVYRKGDEFVAVNFYTTFLVRHEDAPSECPCDVKLLLFSSQSGVQ